MIKNWSRATMLIMALVVLGLTSTYAQVSQGGLPPSFTSQRAASIAKQTGVKAFKAKALAAPNVKALKDEDAEGAEYGRPPRLGEIIEVAYDMENSGEWTILESGKRIWRLAISAPNAVALSLYYDKFYLPQGALLFIYSANQKHVIGAYTSDNNPENGAGFATELVAGDELVLEYVSPEIFSTNLNKPAISVSGVAYVYNDNMVQIADAFFDTPMGPGAEGNSGSCMVNINCSEGAAWQNQKTSVVASVQRAGTSQYFCTGAVVNNTARNMEPYYLTAFHCGMDANDDDLNQWIFYFHFERTGCDNSSSVVKYKTLTGAKRLVSLDISGSSDGLLLRLNENIPSSYNVFYSGWDRRNVAPASGVNIHHPMGDLKKISTYGAGTSTATWTGQGTRGANNAHWLVYFLQTEHGWGITEGGSSGSPLFDQNGRIVGTLSGGNTTCTNTTGRSYYGKLWYHWDQAPSASMHMAKYLDPINTGETYIDGMYESDTVGVNFSISASTIYAMEPVTYNDLSVYAGTWKWTFEGGTPSSYNGKVPPHITYKNPGQYITKLVINEGTVYQRENSKTITVKVKEDTERVLGADSISTSYLPLGSGTNLSKLYTAALYKPSELGWMVGNGAITALAWKADVAFSVRRSVKIYLKHLSASTADLSEYTTYGSLKSGATLLVDTAGVSNIKGYQNFVFNAGTKRFLCNADSALLVIVETDFGLNQTHATGTPYTNVRNSVRYWEGTTSESVNAGSATRSSHQRPNIRITYHQSAVAPVANFIMNGSLSNTIVVYRGDTVLFNDRSVGPPVLYKWKFEGGSIDSSSQPQQSVIYNKLGTYKVSLKVTNSFGVSSKQTTVEVRDHVPGADMLTLSNSYRASGNGHNMTNGGQSLPTAGGRVNFQDMSRYYPNSWNWSFPGAAKTASQDSKPRGILYGKDESGVGTSYDVILRASNTAGTSIDTLKNAVQVGGTAEVWNVYGDEVSNDMASLVAVTSYNGIPIYATAVGGNYSLFDKVSERFEFDGFGLVSEVSFYSFPLYGNTSLLVEIFSDENGLPGSSLGMIQTGNLPYDYKGYYEVAFVQPIPVQGTFHVVFSQYSGSGTRIIAQTPLRGYENNTVTVNYNDGWLDLAEITYNASMDVAVKYTYSEFELLSKSEYSESNVQQRADTIRFSSNASRWSASADSWINLSAANGTVVGERGQLTFTCAENPLAGVRYGNIVVASGGGLANIRVVQGGAAPRNLQAEYSDAGQSVNLSWSLLPKIAPSTNMVDSVEGHASFAINSPGAMGWSYIDGDGLNTYTAAEFSGINAYVIPSAGRKMAFTVFDYTATVPSMEGSNYTSLFGGHSGKKSFACISAKGAANNDWIVSPQLNFSSSFTFSFWARSVDDNYKESFKVLYSTGGKSQSDFNHVLGAISAVPNAWTKYTYTIPAGATFVTVNCTSNEKVMLLLDDLYIGTGSAPSTMSYTLSANDQAGSISLARQPLPALPALPNVVFEKQSMSTSPLAQLGGQNIPMAEGDKAVLRWDNGTLSGNIGITTKEPLPMEVAIRFTPDDLIKYGTSFIKSVDIGIGYRGRAMVLNIRQGDEIIYSQGMSGLLEGVFNTIELDEAVAIDPNKDLMIGYAFIQINSQFVMGVDAGPAKVDKGDLVSIDGGEFSSSGYKGNWSIAATLVEGAPMVKYNVYRDGQQIANGVDANTYVDTTMPQASNVCYNITTVYNNDSTLESSFSAQKCVYAKSIIYITANNATRTEIEKNPTFSGKITKGDLIHGDMEPVILSKVSYKSANPLMPAGVYGIAPVLDSLRANATYTSRYVFVAVNGTLTITMYPTEIAAQPVGASVCQGESYTMSIGSSGLNVEYQWQKLRDTSWVDAGSPVYTSGLTGQTGSFTFSNATPEEAGYYRVLVNGRSDKKVSDTVIFRVGIPHQDIVEMKWGNIPAINCNVETNGEHDFFLFQWYKNGSKVEGATKPYIKLGSSTTSDTYFCEMETRSRVPLAVCPFAPVVAAASLSVYPTVVEQGGLLYVKTEGIPEGATAALYNANGVMVKASIVLQGTSSMIELGRVPQGMYMLQVTAPNGVKQATKVVVN